MRTYRSRPHPDAGRSLPHGDARENRQPYATEHEDYNDGVAKPPEEQGGKNPPDAKKMRPRRR
jgi:hypothetical protein